MGDILCFVCGKKNDIILFNRETLSICQEALKIRKLLKYKYANVSTDEQKGYHIKCYRAFTALKTSARSNALEMEQSISASDDQEPNTSTAFYSLRGCANLILEKNATVFKNQCIFCDKSNLTVRRQKVPLISCCTKNFENNLKQAVLEMNDAEMLPKVIGEDFIAKEVKYHKICQLQYEKKYHLFLKLRESTGSETLHLRNQHEKCFEIFSKFLIENILQNGEAIYLNDVLDYYKQTFFELFEENCDNYRSEKLEFKIKKFFNDEIEIQKYKSKKILIQNGQAINLVGECLDNRLKLQNNIRSTAMFLRQVIMNLKKNETDKFLDASSIPDEVFMFVNTLIKGTSPGRENSARKDNYIKSIAQDMIYCTTSGSVKCKKQYTLGMTMKSITSSRKVLNILNRLGHSISYSKVEEFETELAFSASEENKILPQGLAASPGLCTGLSFDNYDRYIDTRSGKDTLHDTVGIVYQNVSNLSGHFGDFKHYTPPQKRMRRCFEGISSDVVPFSLEGKKCSVPFSFLSNHTNTNDIEMKKWHLLDLAWVASLAFKIEDTPMWQDYNRQLIKDNSSIQVISYLPQINESPTSESVVHHTLKITENVGLECGQQYTCVTFDLAIAKIAMKIQLLHPNMYPDVFIKMGEFHVTMAYFKAIGKFIDNCGLTYILNECEILAEGSANGVIEGKHYNRCKRIYEQLYAANKILHFEAFLDQGVENLDGVIEALREFKNSQILSTNENSISFSDVLTNFLQQYQIFWTVTLTGERGKTAQFHAIFCELIENYFLFNRSIKMGNYSLYKAALEKINDVFFIFNQPNYARWLLVYQENLLSIEKNKPEIVESVFKSGAFTIKRTPNSFSRSPVHLCTEQTINADAGNKLTGLTHFQSSISARNRWAVTHTERTKIIHSLMEELGLLKTDDCLRISSDSAIRKQRETLQRLISQIKNCMNPFDPSLDKNYLYNLASGKATSDVTANFLLNVPGEAKKLKEKFIKECAEQPDRFEKPITKVKLHTFANDTTKIVSKKNNKVSEVVIERDIFARTLAIALEKQVDMANILSYPLTPVPLTFCHLDGTMYTTDKSKLFHILEKKLDSNTSPPAHLDAIIIDGFAFLHQMKNLPTTYSSLAQFILNKLLILDADRIDIVFDQYKSPSIKDVTRDYRAVQGRKSVFEITGGDQKRPNDFLGALRNDNFKEALVAFMVNFWLSVELPHGKVLNVTKGNDCYSYSNIDGEVMWRKNDDLQCDHEEADSRMMLHLVNCSGNVVIKTQDTDVLVIILSNMYHHSNSVWLEVGKYYNNTHRFINCNELNEKLGNSLCASLPGFHAFTGCDYTPAFHRKGKLSPFKILEKSPKFQNCFQKFGSGVDVQQLVPEIQEFVCEIYNVKNCKDVNECRWIIFQQKYSIKKKERKFLKNISFSSSCMPPCLKTLLQQIKRCNYICSRWRFQPEQEVITPCTSGWLLHNGELVPHWYEGEMAPSLIEVAKDHPEELDLNEDDDLYTYTDSSDSDSE